MYKAFLKWARAHITGGVSPQCQLALRKLSLAAARGRWRPEDEEEAPWRAAIDVAERFLRGEATVSELEAEYQTMRRAETHLRRDALIWSSHHRACELVQACVHPDARHAAMACLRQVTHRERERLLRTYWHEQVPA